MSMTVKEFSERLKEFPEDAIIMAGVYFWDDPDIDIKPCYEHDLLTRIEMKKPFRYSDGTPSDVNVVYLTNDKDPEK